MFNTSCAHIYLIIRECINKKNIMIDKNIIKNIILIVFNFNKLMRKIKKYPYYLGNIPQTKQICDYALNLNWETFFYIKNKTPELCEKAVTLNGNLLRYIDNQTYRICLCAILDNPDAMQFVRDKSFNLCHHAILSDEYGYVIKYIKDPVLELCIVAVNKNPRSIKYIKNPIDYLCNMALKKGYDNIKYIKGKDQKYYIDALKVSGYAIKHIKNPTEEMCIEALKQNINVEKYIEINSTRLYLYKLYLNTNRYKILDWCLSNFIVVHYPVMTYLYIFKFNMFLISKLIILILWSTLLKQKSSQNKRLSKHIIISFVTYLILFLIDLVTQKQFYWEYNIILYFSCILKMILTTGIGWKVVNTMDTYIMDGYNAVGEKIWNFVNWIKSFL